MVTYDEIERTLEMDTLMEIWCFFTLLFSYFIVFILRQFKDYYVDKHEKSNQMRRKCHFQA